MLGTLVHCSSFTDEPPPGSTPDGSSVDASPEAQPGAGVVDADAEPALVRCDRGRPFGDPAEVTELNDQSTVGNFVARLTDDGREVFFGRALTTTDIRIFHATRASRTDPFGEPVEVEGLGHAVTELDSHPSPLPDGKGLYFQRSVGGGAGGRDILYAPRVNGIFTGAKGVSGLSDSVVAERSPYLSLIHI